jgi:hypothetical protein
VKQNPQQILLKNQLKGLSLDQKKELLESLKTKELLKKEKILDSFKPNAVQEPFFQSPSRIRALIGANAVGKTTALIWEIVNTHIKTHPYRDVSNIFHTWVIVPSYDKIEDYWLKVQELCPPSKFPDKDKMGTSHIRRLRWQDGGTTTFYSHDQEPSKLEGTNYDALFIDEPCPRDQFVAAFRGLRSNPDYFIVMALTPISEPWIYEDIYQPWALKKDPNIAVFTGTIFQNESNLGKGFIQEFKNRLSDDEIRTRLYGEFQHLQGRVFKEFTRGTHVYDYQKWPSDWPVYMAIDPHPRKPHTAIWLGVTSDDIMVVIDELKIEGDIEEFANAIKEKEKDGGYKVVSRRIDNSGSGTDWNRDSFIAQLAKLGIRTSPMRKSEKDVASSLQRIKLLLKNKNLRFLENCVNMISDMELYAWQDYRNPSAAGVNEKPRKIHDDMIDPLRYIIVSNPTHTPTMEVLSTLSDKNPYNKDASKPSLWHRTATIDKE